MLRLERDRAKSCRILHELPGRVRIHCPGLRHLSSEAGTIGGRLRDLPAVLTVHVSAVTENVLVRFEAEKLGAQDVLVAAQSAMSDYSLDVFKAERTLAAQSTVQERRFQEESIGEISTRVIASTVTLAFSVFSSRAAPATFFGRFSDNSGIDRALAGLADLSQRRQLADCAAVGPTPTP